MGLLKVFQIKVVVCPKRNLDVVHVSECDKCEYFGGLKRLGKYSYVNCLFGLMRHGTCAEEVDYDG